MVAGYMDSPRVVGGRGGQKFKIPLPVTEFGSAVNNAQKHDFSRAYMADAPAHRTRLCQLWETNGDVKLGETSPRKEYQLGFNPGSPRGTLGSTMSVNTRSTATLGSTISVNTRSTATLGSTMHSLKGLSSISGTGLESPQSPQSPRSARGPIAPAGSQESTAQTRRTRPSSADSDSHASRASASASRSGASGFATARGTRRQRAEPACDAQSLEYALAFKAACLRKYFSLARAWRLLLDPKANGRVSFNTLCEAARGMGFDDQRRLWSALDRDGSGFVTLDEWDLATYNALLEFRRVCCSSFGGLDCAFAQGMDRKKRSQVYPKDLKAFLSDPIYGFTGNVEVLFRALDLQQQGFFTLDELDFLRSFRGEPHGAASPAAASRMWKERYLDAVGGAATRLPDIHGREQNRQTWAPGDAQRYQIYGNPGAAVTAGLQGDALADARLAASSPRAPVSHGRRGETYWYTWSWRG